MAIKFTYKGEEYHRTEGGYCYRSGKRISKDAYAEAEAAHAERTAKLYKIAETARTAEEDAVNRGSSNIIEVDGHEYAYNYAEGKCWRDGEEITRAEFDRAIGKKSASRAGRKARKPKDVAFEHDGATLTAKQADFLRELAAAGTDGVLGNYKSGWWCDCITDGIGGQFAGKPMTVGAMISTLCEKGLAERSKEKRDNRTVTALSLTERGTKVWRAMGLK